MALHTEDSETYHARPAVSAGLLWDIVDECPALARHRSPWLNPDYVEPEPADYLDNGTLVHLAALQPELL